MRVLSLALLVAGTVLATLGGAHLPRADARPAGVGIALLAAGAVLLRRQRRARSSAPEGARQDVLGALTALPERLDALAREAEALELSELGSRLHRLDTESIQPIADASPDLLPALGVTKFAAVFGAFASGERALARAWCAAADRHRAEALAALERGAERIRAAARAAREP